VSGSIQFDFTGCHVLVTGGTRGIGRAIAEAFADNGATVTATGRNEAEVIEYPPHCNVTAQSLDVTDEAAVGATIARIGRLDVLVNAAGIILREGAEFAPEKFADVIDVNLVGMMRMCVACRSRLANQRGCIVNIASMLSYFGSGAVPAYSASKGGVSQLTKSLAIAWATEGIRVNAVAPGWITTALTQPLQTDPAKNRAIVDRTPMRRWGEPVDVAGPVLFLCSPAAAFVTGTILAADGGYSAM
jgi:NAD(P)-dependent dehydrogenase (short-subunit alcohol dehydrogenase family)